MFKKMRFFQWNLILKSLCFVCGASLLLKYQTKWEFSLIFILKKMENQLFEATLSRIEFLLRSEWLGINVI